MSAASTTALNSRRLVQVAADTWEPTILVWNRIDPSVGDHFTAEWLIGGAR